MFEMDNISYAC